MIEAYIWRDAHDSEQFCIGVKMSSGTYRAWAVVFTDGLYDLFGLDSEVIEARLGTEPTPIRLEMIFPPLAEAES